MISSLAGLETKRIIYQYSWKFNSYRTAYRIKIGDLPTLHPRWTQKRTWWGVNAWTWARSGSRRSGHRTKTSFNWSGGNCSRTWNDCGFVRWQHFTKPSHTFLFFQTFRRENRIYEPRKTIGTEKKHRNLNDKKTIYKHPNNSTNWGHIQQLVW